MKNRVYIVDGARTPFLKAEAVPGNFAASDLAVVAARAVLARLPVELPLDGIVLGCVMPDVEEPNIARLVGSRLGVGAHVPTYTVQRNDGSGMQALASAAEHIALGRAHVVLAGGAEAMSRVPRQWSFALTAWLAGVAHARNVGEQLRAVTRFRPVHWRPVRLVTPELAEPSVGQTAEWLAHRFGITREAHDAYALQSHRRLAVWYDAGDTSGEVELMYGGDGRFYSQDTGLSRDTDMAQLARLRPVVERKYGQVTSGNAAPPADGAAILLLASEEAMRRYQLPVLGEWVDNAWAGVDVRRRGLAPVHAVADLLVRHQLKMRDLQQLELNETFAAQVLACQAAWDSGEYARDALGLDAPLGAMDPERLNPEGGAIACGHPLGASGARLVLHLLHALKQKGGGTGVAALCAGGGQGGAALLRSAEAA